MRRLIAVLLVGPLALLAACGGDDTAASAAGDGDRPSVVVTTSILGDVVTEMLGDAADVEVVMPRGVGPHDFQPSAQQVAAMGDADALVTNGAGFEEGLIATIESTEEAGVPVHHAIDAVGTLPAGEGGDEHADDGAEDGHAHEGVDPHFFTDPERMAEAAEGIMAFLVEEVPALDTDEVATRAGAYVEALGALTASVTDTLSVIPEDRRIMVTNHEVFAYFADRFDFEVVGVIIPGGGTGAEPSAGQLAELVSLVEAEDVPAVFADTSAPTALADALAREAGGEVEVVELFSESLGEDGSGGTTYRQMVQTNADRIADALA